MSLSFLFVDLAVLVVIIGSAAYAVWRGFVSETLSIVAWAIATLASLYFGGRVGTMATSLISTYWIAVVVGYAAVFIAVFIPLQFASHRFSEGVKRSQIGALDRVLGAAFGVVRGLAILGLAYLIFTAVVPIRKQPAWLPNAKTLPLIQASAEVLVALIPDQGPEVRSHPPHSEPSQPVAHPQSIEDLIGKPAPATHTKPAKPKPKPKKKGYGAGDRRALDRLFETTGSGDHGN